MKKKLILILIVFFSGCIHYKNTASRHQLVYIKNNSDKDIYYYYEMQDGSLYYYNPYDVPLYFIEAHGHTIDQDDSFEDTIERNVSKKLVYYFYDAEVLRTVPYDTVYKYKMVLGRKAFTKGQLDSLNWTISFP